MVSQIIDSAIILLDKNPLNTRYAEQLEQALNWPVYSSLNAEKLQRAIVLEHGVDLWLPDYGRFRVDYQSGKSDWRLSQQQGKNELLVKAVCGRKSLIEKVSEKCRILDLTAGLGRDSLLLMNVGFQVCMVERELPLYFLLRQALENLGESLQRDQQQLPLLKVCHLDSELKALDESFDVVYCDPMFPEKSKSAKVKKEAAFLQAFARQSDEQNLLEAAMQSATEKVVIKRPIKASPLANRKPASAILGKVVRYDIYPCQI